jgi:hypothetical protein
LALRLNDQLGPLPPEHAALCKAVNYDATLQSLLYDLNLLPEQTQRDPLKWGYTVAVVAHFDVAVTAERERAEALRSVLRVIAEQDPVELALDPQWSQRIARGGLDATKGPNAKLNGGPPGPSV